MTINIEDLPKLNRSKRSVRQKDSWVFNAKMEGDSGKVSVRIESDSGAWSSPTKCEAVFEQSPHMSSPRNSLSATGRRPDGVGTEDIQQGIVLAQRGEMGRLDFVSLRLTLLVAGFVVGPHGASIHQIENITGAAVRSFNRHGDSEVERPTRQFYIEGSPYVIQHAVDIICHAVKLYKDLTEGSHRCVTVKRLHKLENVLFRYEPPPRARVPFAAQVEYEPVEFAILQSRRDSGCSGEIRCVRRVLARRDEAYMRLALSRPSDQARRPPGRRDAPCSWRGRILDDPEVQTHVTPPRMVDAFDSVLQSWRIRVNSIEKTMGWAL